MYSLDSIGIRAGTDKSRLRQDYLRHYQRMFADFREHPITVLEIGIHQGASLRVWEQFFPLAQIVALDIEPMTKRFERDRVIVEIGSQFDAAFLAAIAARYQPTIIIDDGSHIAAHQIFSFENLFGCLRPGGVYIVEDIAIDEGNEAAAYFNRLQTEILQRRAPASIARSEIIPCAAAYWKAPPPDEMDGNIDGLMTEVRRSERPAEARYYLAEYLRRSGNPGAAAPLAREALDLEPNDPWIANELATNLDLLGQREEAIALLVRLATVTALPPVVEQKLAHWSNETNTPAG